MTSLTVSNDQKRIPSFDQFMNPIIRALHSLGGSGTIDEINEKIFEMERIPAEVLSLPHGDQSSRSEVEYRIAWARTYLKKYGILENSSRGVWSLASAKTSAKEVNPQVVVKFVRAQKKTYDLTGVEKQEIIGETADEPEEFTDWKVKLKAIVSGLSSSAFERLVQRLLRESGFIQVEVTGKSGDGGIDGKGIMRVGGLLSFHVMFQCKKYQGSVSASHVRDFRGALQGRADKGL